MEPMYHYYDINGNGVADLPLDYVVRHQQTQTIRYDCSKCESSFSTRTFLHEHEVSQHNHKLLCPSCPALFSNKADFRTHWDAHLEKFLPCGFCKKVFYQPDEYSAHVREHGAPYIFTCDKCPAQFNQYSMLRNHNKTTHVHKKFIHTIPDVSENCSSKKLLKKVRKELKYINKITRAQKRSRADSQTTDSVAEVRSAPLNSVPSMSASDSVSDIQSEDDIQMIESDIPNVADSNMIKNNVLTSDASTSTDCVTAPDPLPCTSSGKTRRGISTEEAICKKKNVLKRKRTPPENVKPDNISPRRTRNSVNVTKSAVLDRKRRKCVSQSRINEDVESVDEIVTPLTSTRSNENDSPGRNLRPKNTAKNCYDSSGRNLRPRNTAEHFCLETFLDPDEEVIVPPENNESNAKKSSSSEDESVDEIVTPLTSTRSNENDSPGRNLRPRNTAKNCYDSSGRNLRPRNTAEHFYLETFLDPDEEVIVPPENNESNANKSSSSGSSAVEPKANYNLRRAAKGRNAVPDETSQPKENDNVTENATSSRSYIPTGFFMCLSCKRIFPTYSLLNLHKELHIKNVGIRCDKCGGLFRNAGNLVKHQKSAMCVET